MNLASLPGCLDANKHDVAQSLLKKLPVHVNPARNVVGLSNFDLGQLLILIPLEDPQK